MMAKIIGKDDSKVRRVTCHNCASRLEFTNSEVDTRTYIDYGGGSDTLYYIICPNCSFRVEVKQHG